jgi:hypothetical protein
MGVDRDKQKFGELISVIDRSITNGMTQDQVIGILGSPRTWSTNGNTADADYYWPTIGVFDGYTTNGFVITFSNGVVLRKSQIFEFSQ